MPVELVLLRKSIAQDRRSQLLTIDSHIKGVASHKIVTDGRSHVA